MTKKHAFTLLELSIVLAIVGLIIGGIVIGQSLVRQGQLRAAVSEYDTYLKAIKEFQDKYLALPGDMSNATSVWTTSATANGNGSGTIGTSSTAGVIANTAGTGGINGISNPAEWFLAWQHLALAGFIPGSYPGTYSSISTQAVIGTNVPTSKAGAGWALFYYLNTTNGATGLWPDQYGHLLTFGAYSASNPTIGPILTPAEAADIDIKFDDGMPGTGKIRSWRTSVLAHCTCNDTSQTALTYNSLSTAPCTAYTGQACSLVFLLGF